MHETLQGYRNLHLKLVFVKKNVKRCWNCHLQYLRNQKVLKYVSEQKVISIIGRTRNFRLIYIFFILIFFCRLNVPLITECLLDDSKLSVNDFDLDWTKKEEPRHYFSIHRISNETNILQVLVGHSDIVTCVAVSITNKTQIVSGSWDCNLIVWDINTGSDLHLLSGHLGKVTCVKVTGDGTIGVSSKYKENLIINLQIIIDQV